MTIDTKERYQKRRAKVLDIEMAYIEFGKGDPILFLHGNPTYSYLWRNVIPYLKGLGRCIAPDLIGMGESDKLPESGPDRYSFIEHRKYLDELLKVLVVQENVILVGHDWGSALAFDWARRHPHSVKGIAYMEAIVSPYSWDDFYGYQQIFRDLRSPKGEKMILENNFFVEELFPKLMLRKLTEEEMAIYRRPFLEPGESRRPTLSWPRQLPLDGEPADVTEIVDAYAKWMAQNKIPKLFINAEPGAAIRGAVEEFCRTWSNQTEVKVTGLHFIQEDCPDDIGKAIAGWYQEMTG